MQKAPTNQNSLLDLQKHIGKQVHVKFLGGREGNITITIIKDELTLKIVIGILRGYDQLVNLVLDDAVESRAVGGDEAGPTITTTTTTTAAATTTTKRNIGRTICRGTSVMFISPQDGYESIANPFLQAEEES